MKTSFAHLCITCQNEEAKERVKALLGEVTPFEEVDGKLIYMELESEDAMEIPAMLEDLVLLLEEHKEALSSAGNLRDCTLEMIARLPLSCSSRACPKGVLEFVREIGATVVMNGEKAVDFDRVFQNVIGYTGVPVLVKA